MSKLTASRLAEIASDLCLPDARIHQPGSAARAWQFQGDYFYEWDSAPKDVKKWQGLVVTVEGKPSLCLITDLKETPDGIKGRLTPTTGVDFITHHWMDANLPAKSDVELRLKIDCLKTALSGQPLVSVAEALS